jgi:predicted  nucleic acid-binding Zn-ribbon protein
MKRYVKKTRHITRRQQTHRTAHDLLKHLVHLLTKTYTQGRHLMALVQDIQAQITALQASVGKETTVVESVKTLVQGLAATIAALKQQLADAIANGADPAALQAVLDSLTAAETTIEANTQALADAVTAGTPPDQPPAFKGRR